MSIKKNFTYNLLYQILIMIIPLITTPYISRIIGAEGTGIQSYTYSIANYFVIFSMLGINNHGNRSIAMVRDSKEKLSKTFFSIYAVQIVMATIMLILYFSYVNFMLKDNKMIMIIQSLYIIGALLDINWFFFGIEQFKLTVVRNTIIKVLSLICIFIFVKSETDLYKYSFILALSTFLSQLVLWRYVNKYIKIVKITIKDILNNIKPIIVLFIPVISISIYKIMDKIMLGNMSSMIEVGFYENAEKIINIPLGIIVSLGTVMLPKMSNLYAKGNKEIGLKYIKLSIEFSIFMAVGAMFGLIGISSTFIPFFLGDNFISCIPIVSILSITLVFLSWANVIRTQYLIPNKKDKIYVTSTILGAVINLVVNLLLIKSYGAVGAAIGTVCAEGTVSIYQTIMLKNELDIRDYLKKSSIYIIPGLIMCMSIYYISINMKDNIITGIMQVIIGALIYIIFVVIGKIIIKDKLIYLYINKLTYKIKK